MTNEKNLNKRSTIEFPYGDLNDAIEIANIIHSKYGIECETDQLAAALNSPSKGGSFRSKVSSARVFGATENERGRVILTDLGRRLTNPKIKRKASVEAFLGVELYNKIFEKFKGSRLPPPEALEKVMIGMGVVEKQVPRVRQAFNRSAEQAGFFESGKDRLVKPGNLGLEHEADLDHKGSETDSQKISTPIDDNRNFSHLDPFIQGLLKRLPDADSEWGMKERANWLIAAEHVFKLIYKEKIGDLRTIEIVLAGEIDDIPF